MHIGILGAGRMGQALARLLVGAGYSVRLANSRGPDSLADLVAELGPQAAASTPAELVRGSDVVILATRWDQAPAALAETGPWNGTILIDTTNNRFGPNPGDVYDLGDQTSSEAIAAMAPGARVVKAFNHQPIPSLSTNLGPTPLEQNALFLAGDDPEARAAVAQIISAIGGEPFDMGELRAGGRLFATGGGPLAGFGRMLSPAEAREIIAAQG